jgi:aryl-phospho-beta-D-glucosidase BglC (GH1 family)
MSAADMRMLKRLGFDHVRLIIDPAPLVAEAHSGSLWPKALAVLDRTIRDLTGAELNVVLDIQPDEKWKEQMAAGNAGAADFFAFWGAFAAHFASTDPEKVFFEVMNEPSMDDAFRWEGLQARAIARIRSVAAAHTLIAEASPYSDIESLIAMEPVRDENVIYSFHEYDPKWFTHQGATWGNGAWAFLRGVPYPATPENMQAVLAQEPDEQERLMLERFAWERWDASRIAAEVTAADQWARRRGVPLYCGEFGVYKEYADPKARARWIGDVRMALESRHIAWAMWDYNGNFGLMSESAEKVADRDILTALGLKE